jgi:hypothetical protein
VNKKFKKKTNQKNLYIPHLKNNLFLEGFIFFVFLEKIVSFSEKSFSFRGKKDLERKKKIILEIYKKTSKRNNNNFLSFFQK